VYLICTVAVLDNISDMISHLLEGGKFFISWRNTVVSEH
jgi:hypothetical protein